jgi:putative ubiquitin-RnfH superfamily antitoxin RatB of RatAB toxin-antitoxin module
VGTGFATTRNGVARRNRRKIMTCEILGTDKSLFVAWGVPEVVDIDRVVTQLKLRYELSGGPVLYVNRVPADAPAPCSEVQRHIKRVKPGFVDQIAAYYVILEGNGFTAAVKRAVLLGLTQVSLKRGKFHIYATANELLRSVAPGWRLEVERLLVLAEQRNLLDGIIPCDRIAARSGSFALERGRGKPPKNSSVA